MKPVLKRLLSKRIYRRCDLDYSTRDLLSRYGYREIVQRDLQGKQEEYVFRPYYHESARHAVSVLEIYEYLKQHVRDVKQYLTVKPDIVFRVHKHEYAIEVETGVTLKRNKPQLLAKVASLREDFGNKWFFVVTDRNLVKAYRRYGKTYSKRNVLMKIEVIIKREWLARAIDKERERRKFRAKRALAQRETFLDSSKAGSEM